MKTSAMITMAAMLAGSAWAATKSDSQRLVVCIEDGKHAGVADATAKASSLFLSAGVKLDWHGELNDCKGRPDAMVVSFRAMTPKTFHPGALAYALPYEGCAHPGVLRPDCPGRSRAAAFAHGKCNRS